MGKGPVAQDLLRLFPSETKKESNKWTVPVGEVMRKAYSYMSTESQRLHNKADRQIRNFYSRMPSRFTS